MVSEVGMVPVNSLACISNFFSEVKLLINVGIFPAKLLFPMSSSVNVVSVSRDIGRVPDRPSPANAIAVTTEFVHVTPDHAHTDVVGVPYGQDHPDSPFAELATDNADANSHKLVTVPAETGTSKIRL